METSQRLKHILYRLKQRIFYQSRLSLFIRSKIWRQPLPGTVKVLIKREQDISHYFRWEEIQDATVRMKLKEFTDRYAKEPDIVYKVSGDIFIEPNYALAIQKGRRFIKESSTLSHIYLKPSLSKYLYHYYIIRKYTCYDHVVLCDGFAGANLCHFIYDTINPILFLYEQGFITPETPIIVSEKVYQKTYFQYFLKNTFLGNLRWVVQSNKEWLRVNSFIRAFVSMEQFYSMSRLCEAKRNPHRRIFLNRKSKYQRNINNIVSILDILKRYEFEIVYAEDLSYEEQVKLFQEVKYFVGIHGAGLTNLLHADIPSLRVLEVFSESLVHASFYRFLAMLKVDFYDAIAGSKFDINWNFTVNEQEFEKRIKILISK